MLFSKHAADCSHGKLNAEKDCRTRCICGDTAHTAVFSICLIKLEPKETACADGDRRSTPPLYILIFIQILRIAACRTALLTLPSRHILLDHHQALSFYTVKVYIDPAGICRTMRKTLKFEKGGGHE